MTQRHLIGEEAKSYIENTLGFNVGELAKFPKYFLIETINACNARCIMCGIDFSKKKKATMSDELFRKIAEELHAKADCVEKVMLYLDGEPLLDRDMPRKITRIKDAGIKKINIATNASLLSKATGEALITAGLDEIYITIDSLKKDIYEKIRVGLQFEIVYKNIVNFIALRNKMNPLLSMRIQMIQQELNISESKTFIEHWKKLLKPNDQIAVQKAHNWANAAKVMKFGDEEMMNLIPCIAIWGTCVIHVNGDVPLCCLDSKTKILLGNVTQQTIAEIWNSESIEALRRTHLAGERSEIPLCNGCTLWRENKRRIDRVNK